MIRVGAACAAVLLAGLTACGGGTPDNRQAYTGEPNGSASQQAKGAAQAKDMLMPTVVAPNVGGQWSRTSPWPFLPIHAALTPDGRVLTYGGNGGQQGGQMSYDIWDPAVTDQAQAHLTLPNGTTVDTFCSAGLLMPQSGNLLIVSGDANGRTDAPLYRNRDVLAYDYRTSGLSRLEGALNHQRWYGTLTMLTSGEVMIQGGTCWAGNSDFCGGAVMPTTPEIFRTGRGWVSLSGARDDDLFGARDSRWWYPRAWQAPDGRVFGIAAGTEMYWIDPKGDGSLLRAGSLDRSHFGATNSAVMYRPGKILMTGGGGVDSNGQEPNGSALATVIDIRSGKPVISRAASMRQGRQWHNSTVLPDGKVLVTGGSTRNNTLEGLTNQAEVWDPDTGRWTLGNAADTPRLYHSFAILLPDGRVLTGGGGAPGPGPFISGAVYHPAYLFDKSGGFASRPTIARAPGQIGGASESFTIGVESSKAIRKVTLVGAGAVTHSFDMGQRYVELPYAEQAGSITVRLPANRNEVPPGFYMLFVIDADGVPSVARMVRVLRPDTEPSPDQDVDANLIHNGSFEASSSESRVADGDFLVANWPGWINENGTSVEIWRRHMGAEAAHGRHFMELDVDAGRRDRVYQHVYTVPGKRYRLSLWFAPRPGVTADSNAFEVTWNGRRIAGAAPDGTAGGAVAWRRLDVYVTGTGRDRLALNETGVDDGFGVLIDDIRLVGETNLVANGGFEDNDVPAGEYALQTVSGWRSSTGVLEVWREHLGYSAAQGQSWIEIDANPSSHDRVEQAIATEVGRAYRVSLSFAARPMPAGWPSDTSAFQVYWNGTLLDTIVPKAEGSGPRDLDWRTRSWVVVGTGRDSLSIVEAGPDDGYGALLDHVSVVPEALLQGNTGFEVNDTPEGGWSLRPLIGWTNKAGLLETWRGGEVPAAVGRSLAEIDVGLSTDTIAQTLTTQPGRKYRIAYKFRGRPGVVADSNAFNVRWNGQIVASHRPDGTVVGQGWQTAEVTVTATGFDLMEFVESGANDGYGALLDEVTVTLVP